MSVKERVAHLAGKQPASELLFLELRFGVLAGHYLPGQAFARDALGEAYGLGTVTLTGVLNTLVLEGYLMRTKPGHYAVKTWSGEEIEDLYDMRASLLGIAAAKAATRASEAEIAMLKGQLPGASSLAFGNPEDIERAIHASLGFHAEVLKMSKIAALPQMARTLLPNALHRRCFWAQSAGELFQSFRVHRKIAAAIAERNAAMARVLVREEVYASREAVLAENAALAVRPCEPVARIERLSGTSSRTGRVFGLGTRETAVDGKVIPLGIPASQIG